MATASDGEGKTRNAQAYTSLGSRLLRDRNTKSSRARGASDSILAKALIILTAQRLKWKKT